MQDLDGEFTSPLWNGSPISKQEVSAPINVTFDPAESPIPPGQNILCTYASEYNP